MIAKSRRRNDAKKSGCASSRFASTLTFPSRLGDWRSLLFAFLDPASAGGAEVLAAASTEVVFIIVADLESLRPKKLTISAWVNPDSGDHSSTWRGIVTKSTSESWTGGFGLSRYPSSPDAHFFVNDYSTETAHAPIPDNTWTHLVGTYDEQTLTLYVNGVKAASLIPQGSYGGAIQHDSSPLLIGQGWNGYGWFGKFDEVMLFNRVLSAREISSLYQLTKAD